MTARILIAEDDEMQGAALRAVLQSRGHAAESVTDGFEAVRRLRRGHYDIALLDYRMPEVSGLATAQLLHDLLDAEDCPRLIAVTALADELSEKERQSSGKSFDAIVSKQVGLQALLAVVDASLAHAAEARAAAAAGQAGATDGAAAPDGVPAGASLPAMLQSKPVGLNFVPVTVEGVVDYPAGARRQSEGQLHVLSLAAFRLTLGAEWQRVGLNAMMRAEHIIKRRLSTADVLTRSGDHGFIIWFGSTDSEQNEAVLAGAVREIRLRFLIDFGQEVSRNASMALGQTVT